MRFEPPAATGRIFTRIRQAAPAGLQILRRTIARRAGVLLAAAFVTVHPAWAAYPEQPVTIIVPYPPGGPADLVARPLGAALQKRLGTPVLLEYKPGAGGQIALRYVQRARNDGYTLVLALAAYAIGPLVSQSAGYDPIKDFQPVSLVAKQPLVLYVGPNSRFHSVADLIQRAKSNPERVTVASSGYGNTSHLAIELLSQAAGIRVMHVPYHGGVPSVAAAMSGDVDAVFAGADSLRYVSSGKLRALAVAADVRLPIAPETPTFVEAGVRNMFVTGWYGVLAPKGTPGDRIETLDLAIRQALSELTLNEMLAGYGFKVLHAGPADFQMFIEQELARWKRLIVDRRIVPEQTDARADRPTGGTRR
ncbi:BUG/TctC family periplasmic protein [Cupriavidus sp. U2]|uniref:Bug family tripartite tricarboxylate transporter substrate binding protein n=1 Tax=Cupriavidus sp. U2 TaxID=2920269 RepID=UPI00129ED406|nr:tripartite tricarboxylate transporter substrate binding protein [Cupriavidus sp. U2]KAI3593697.1 BUG/TctC family periplasmic protein [Cupriavidus sp. U2]